jgi:hypothetical protein
MPHVSTHSRVIAVSGHHRQPRNGPTFIEPYPGSEAEAVPGTTWTSFASPELSYLSGGQEQEAKFLFWSASDGTNGATSANPQLSQLVGDSTLNLTAWYLPPGGTGPGGGPGYFLDAFSVAHGDFIDDTFVDVISDPSLTSEANVVGDISTASAETLQARGSVVSTGESFEQWIAASNANPPLVASGAQLVLPAQTSGVAIASYRKATIPTPNLGGLSKLDAWVILFGIIQDGGGLEYHPGGHGGPTPVGPWGPFVESVARAAGVGVLSSGMSHGAGARIQLLAAQEALAAAEVNLKAVQSAAEQKGAEQR